MELGPLSVLLGMWALVILMVFYGFGLSGLVSSLTQGELSSIIVAWILLLGPPAIVFSHLVRQKRWRS